VTGDGVGDRRAGLDGADHGGEPVPRLGRPHRTQRDRQHRQQFVGAVGLGADRVSSTADQIGVRSTFLAPGSVAPGRLAASRLAAAAPPLWPL